MEHACKLFHCEISLIKYYKIKKPNGEACISIKMDVSFKINGGIKKKWDEFNFF